MPFTLFVHISVRGKQTSLIKDRYEDKNAKPLYNSRLISLKGRTWKSRRCWSILSENFFFLFFLFSLYSSSLLIYLTRLATARGWVFLTTARNYRTLARPSWIVLKMWSAVVPASTSSREQDRSPPRSGTRAFRCEWYTYTIHRHIALIFRFSRFVETKIQYTLSMGADW